MHEKGPCNLAVRANLATAFLEAIGAWLRLPRFQRRHYLLGKKPPAWPKRIGTPWAYLICATAMAHCKKSGTRGRTVDGYGPACRLELRGQVIVTGLEVAGNWSSVTLALSPTSPHAGQHAPAVTAVRTPSGMYICSKAGANVLGLGGVSADLLRDEWQETDEEEISQPRLPHMDTDPDSDDGDLAEWFG